MVRPFNSAGNQEPERACDVKWRSAPDEKHHETTTATHTHTHTPGFITSYLTMTKSAYWPFKASGVVNTSVLSNNKCVCVRACVCGRECAGATLCPAGLAGSCRD